MGAFFAFLKGSLLIPLRRTYDLLFRHLSSCNSVFIREAILFSTQLIMLHLAGSRAPAHQVHVGLKAVSYISEAKLRKTIFVKDYKIHSPYVLLHALKPTLGVSQNNRKLLQFCMIPQHSTLREILSNSCVALDADVHPLH